MFRKKEPADPPPLHRPEPEANTVAVVYYKNNATDEFIRNSNDPLPFPNFLPGFVEFDDGVFINADMIRAIEMKYMEKTND